MKKLVEEWLRYAENDLRTISKIIDDKHLTNVVAFHSHQCIEKSFKAVILLETDTLPKVHNLIKLYGTVRNYVKLNFKMVLLEEINDTYIDTRYPSDLGLLPDGFLSIEHSIDFYNEAKDIFSQIKRVVE